MLYMYLLIYLCVIYSSYAVVVVDNVVLTRYGSGGACHGVDITPIPFKGTVILTAKSDSGKFLVGVYDRDGYDAWRMYRDGDMVVDPPGQCIFDEISEIDDLECNLDTGTWYIVLLSKNLVNNQTVAYEFEMVEPGLLGAILGIIIAITVLCCLVYCGCRRRKRNKSAAVMPVSDDGGDGAPVKLVNRYDDSDDDD